MVRRGSNKTHRIDIKHQKTFTISNFAYAHNQSHKVIGLHPWTAGR